MKIRDIFKDNMWDWRCLYFDLPQNVKLMIQATLLALAAIGEDRLAWSKSPQGNFDLKSTYKMAMGYDLRLSFSVNWIWKLDILPRIQTFVWMCAHNSIGVRDCLHRRGLMEDAKCSLCNRGAESVIHAL